MTLFCKMLLLFLLFLIWSVFLRFLASFLIKDCIPLHSKSLSYVCITDFAAAFGWLLTVIKITNLAPAYFIFLSALQITMHTDAKHMLISRFASIYLVPFGILLSYAELLPISITESIGATLFGYGFLWIANTLFYLLKKHDGLGQGDLELIACIGSFTGFLGCWFTLLTGSITGTIFGSILLLFHKTHPKIMPFGPFLAASAWFFVLFQAEIITKLLLWTY